MSCQAPVVTDLDLILLLLPSVAELVLLPAGLGLLTELCGSAPGGSDDSRV